MKRDKFLAAIISSCFSRLWLTHLIVWKVFACLGHAKTFHTIKKWLACEQVNVGADLSRTPPMYRPGKTTDGPLADTSAMRQ
jgi:hypothetical protein